MREVALPPACPTVAIIGSATDVCVSVAVRDTNGSLSAWSNAVCGDEILDVVAEPDGTDAGLDAGADADTNNGGADTAHHYAAASESNALGEDSGACSAAPASAAFGAVFALLPFALRRARATLQLRAEQASDSVKTA